MYVKRIFLIRLQRKRCSFQSRQNQGLTLAVMSDEIAFDMQNKKLGGTELLSLARVSKVYIIPFRQKP